MNKFCLANQMAQIPVPSWVTFKKINNQKLFYSPWFYRDKDAIKWMLKMNSNLVKLYEHESYFDSFKERVASMNWLTRFPYWPYLLSSETTAEGMGLAKKQKVK